MDSEQLCGIAATTWRAAWRHRSAGGRRRAAPPPPPFPPQQSVLAGLEVRQLARGRQFLTTPLPRVGAPKGSCRAVPMNSPPRQSRVVFLWFRSTGAVSRRCVFTSGCRRTIRLADRTLSRQQTDRELAIGWRISTTPRSCESQGAQRRQAEPSRAPRWFLVYFPATLVSKQRSVFSARHST